VPARLLLHHANVEQRVEVVRLQRQGSLQRLDGLVRAV
jgi:hypothetical protein